MFNFPIGSLTVTLGVLLYWIYFFHLTLIYSIVPLRWKNYNYVVSVSVNFHSNSDFVQTAYDYSCVDWDGLWDYLRGVHGRIS